MSAAAILFSLLILLYRRVSNSSEVFCAAAGTGGTGFAFSTDPRPHLCPLMMTNLGDGLALA